VFTDGSVDPYNPKCVRGSSGSLFRLGVVREAAAVDVLAALQQRGLRCLGTVAHDGVSYDQVDLTSALALVLGSEAHGLPDALGSQLDQQVTIPMRGQVESLNVAMAATVVCFEAQRQRRNREPNGLDATTGNDAGCSAA
jgi:RNA methyltransferase, TrmH family